jgi:hypothetical protein
MLLPWGEQNADHAKAGSSASLPSTKNGKRVRIDEAKLTQTPNGMLIQAPFSRLSPEGHGFHVYAVETRLAPRIVEIGTQFCGDILNFALMVQYTIVPFLFQL